MYIHTYIYITQINIYINIYIYIYTNAIGVATGPNDCFEDWVIKFLPL